jgi:hypothetical protein
MKMMLLEISNHEPLKATEQKTQVQPMEIAENYLLNYIFLSFMHQLDA